MFLFYVMLIPVNKTHGIKGQTGGKVKIRPYFVGEFPSKGSEPVDYVIITTEDLKIYWEPLQDWKREKGINCVIRTVEWIDENYGGGDTPERIRNFLREAHSEWNTRWVLLGGDADKVPTRHVRSDNMYTPYYMIACDYYYSCLNSSWNANQDGMWGEVKVDSCDFTPSLWVGRLFASNSEEVDVNIAKILKYEKDPDTVGLEKVLLITDSTHLSDCVQVGKYFPDHFIKDTLYPPNLARDSMVVWLSRGYANVYAILHGSTAGAFANGFSILQADVLQGECFFMVATSCYTHWIEIDCLTRHFMLNPEGGSFAFLGSSRVGWFNEELQFNKYLYEGIFDSLYSLGSAVCFAKRKTIPNFQFGSGEVSNNHRDVMLSYVLTGDPSVRIWHSSPDSLLVSFPLSVDAGEQEFKVSVKNGALAPVESALVCVSRKNEVYARGYSNAQGEISFEICPESWGTMKVVVVKDGFSLYEGYISINPGSPYVRYKNHFIDGDGFADAGEFLTLSVALENTGPIIAYDVYCKIVCSSAYVVFYESLLEYGDIPSGWDRTQDYQVYIDKDAPDEEVKFYTSAYFMGDTTRDTFSLRVRAPELSHYSHSLIHLSDTLGLSFKIKNDGSTKAIGVKARLKPCSTGITMIDSILEIGSILPHKILDVKKLFKFVGDTVPEFILELSDSFFHIWEDTFKVAHVEPPTELACIGKEYTITVQWKKDSLEAPPGYNVYRAPDTVLLNFTPVIENPLWDDTQLDPYRSYFYWVTSVDSFLNESEFSKMVEGKANPGLKNGWPQRGETHFLSSPVAADIIPSYPGLEIVINGGGDEHVYAWYADGEGILSPDGIFADSTGEAWSALTIADIDGDSILEILRVEYWVGNPRLFAFKPNGEIVPGFPVRLIDDWGTTSYPVVQDLDGDGKLEIIVAGYSGYDNWLYVFRYDGSGFLDPTGKFASLNGGYNKITSPAVADIDGDDTLEIIVASRDSLPANSEFYVFKPNGETLPGWPVYINGAPSLPAIGDIDLSYPGLETVIHTDAGQVYLFHADGSLADGWPQFCATDCYAIMSSPVLGDINGDSTLEILLAGKDYFYVWNKDGTNFPNWPVNIPAMGMVSLATILIGDVDGDDDLEIIGISHMGDVYAFQEDGSIVLGFPITCNGRTDGTPILADIDFDGQNDLVLATRDAEIKVWEVMGTRVEWGTLAHDRWHTGLYGFIPPDTFNAIGEDFRPQPPQFKLYCLSPNPFTKSTAISYSVPYSSAHNKLEVSLEIYDISGRKVKTLVNSTQVPGRYTVAWSPKNIPAGVFFVRLQVGDSYVDTKKTILIK